MMGAGRRSKAIDEAGTIQQSPWIAYLLPSLGACACSENAPASGRLTKLPFRFCRVEDARLAAKRRSRRKNRKEDGGPQRGAEGAKIGWSAEVGGSRRKNQTQRANGVAYSGDFRR